MNAQNSTGFAALSIDTGLLPRSWEAAQPHAAATRTFAGRVGDIDPLP